MATQRTIHRTALLIAALALTASACGPTTGAISDPDNTPAAQASQAYHGCCPAPPA